MSMCTLKMLVLFINMQLKNVSFPYFIQRLIYFLCLDYYIFVTQAVSRGPFIAWQRFCELARLRIAYCLSVCLCFACLTCNITRDVTIELAHCLGIVNWYWLLIQPFARQAVRWGPFIWNRNQGRINVPLRTSNFKTRTHERGYSDTRHCQIFHPTPDIKAKKMPDTDTQISPRHSTPTFQKTEKYKWNSHFCFDMKLTEI